MRGLESLIIPKEFEAQREDITINLAYLLKHQTSKYMVVEVVEQADILDLGWKWEINYTSCKTYEEAVETLEGYSNGQLIIIEGGATVFLSDEELLKTVQALEESLLGVKIRGSLLTGREIDKFEELLAQEYETLLRVINKLSPQVCASASTTEYQKSLPEVSIVNV